MKSRQRLFLLKSVPTDPSPKNGWNEDDHPRNLDGTFTEKNRTLPARSAEIETQDQAADYWKKNFVDEGPHPIRCKYNKKKYLFYVTFERNHSFTEDVNKTGNDDLREFALERAQAMDGIWPVLNHPNAITKSKDKANRRVFSKVINLIEHKFGRVVLELDGDYQDTEHGDVPHYKFVSWHPINQSSYNAALKESARGGATPIIKKALPEDRAIFVRSLNPQCGLRRLQDGGTIQLKFRVTTRGGGSFELPDKQNCRKSFDSDRCTEHVMNDSRAEINVKPILFLLRVSG